MGKSTGWIQDLRQKPTFKREYLDLQAITNAYPTAKQRNALFSDTQLFDDFAISFDILLHKVMQQTFTLADHSQKRALA